VAISSGIVATVKEHYKALFRSDITLGMPIHLRPKVHIRTDVKEVDHHLCHAASAYYTSGLDKSLILTIDGIGEDVTETVSIAQGKDIKPLYYVKNDGVYLRGQDDVFRVHRFKAKKPYSLGWFYGMVTEGLGWRMCCDEGKTMGLAPYGDPSIIPDLELREAMFKIFPEGYYHNNGQVHYHFHGSLLFKKLAEKYGRENLAAAAQKKIEDKVIRLVNKWVKRTGIKNLCTAGGVFLNVKLNQRIIEECGLDNYWPFPLASDCGASIGAAFVEYYKHCDTYKPKRITNLYWGPEYSDEQINAVLDRNKIVYKPYDVKYVAQKLAENKIVAWFQGKMEGGPRALGGRSILMSPLKAENKDAINATVKFREGFRPFCPSVAVEAANKYFDGGNEFMIIASKVKTSDVPAVTHVDGTARPQIVRKEDNPKFHELLTAFGIASGHPVLLNTSFNVMGEPIIRSPEEAIRCFYGVGLDVLVLGNFVIEKGGA
jgi:carbamoyltransferase